MPNSPIFCNHYLRLKYIYKTRKHMLRRIYLLIFLIQGINVNSQVDRGLVARYSFSNGSTKDEVGTNNAKAYNLKPALDRFGNSNSAFFFQGNFDSYLNLGTDSVLKPKIGSISLWVKIEQIMYKGRGILCNEFIYTRSSLGPDFDEAFAIGYNFDLRKIYSSNSNSELEQISLHAVNTSYLHNWYHVVYTYDDHYASLYLDGALVSKCVKNFETRFLTNDSLMVGCHNEKKNTRTFHGVIDDIAIYNRVLSPDEVLQLYAAPNPNKSARILKWVLSGLGLMVIILIVLWLVKKRIAKAIRINKEKSELKARLIELETRAIRTQMNPHFIFNSLNTLQRFILEDEKEKSYTYLIEFSRLLRKLLESSESDTISLKEEIEILTAYLEIEKLRFDNSFEYKINSEMEQMEQVYIPFMLVQPFAENAIWHGLLNKKGLRLLTVSFKRLDERRIVCEIDDNGVGRDFKTNNVDPIKKKSLALDFIKQRLELLEQSTGIKMFIEYY